MTADHSATRTKKAQETDSQGLEGLRLLVHDPSPDVLIAVAADSALTEDLALTLLARRDLPARAIEAVSKNGGIMKHRKVLLGVVCHPHAPRHVSLPAARHLYTFELMQIALTPAIAADVKLAVEESLVSRLDTISPGERLVLAKRASTRVAAALLADSEECVVEAALVNPYMTETWIVRALMQQASQVLVELVSRHAKWSLRREVRIALLRNAKTPLARVLAFARALPTSVLSDVLLNSRLDPNIKTYLLKELEARAAR